MPYVYLPTRRKDLPQIRAVEVATEEENGYLPTRYAVYYNHVRVGIVTGIGPDLVECPPGLGERALEIAAALSCDHDFETYVRVLFDRLVERVSHLSPQRVCHPELSGIRPHRSVYGFSIEPTRSGEATVVWRYRGRVAAFVMSNYGRGDLEMVCRCLSAEYPLFVSPPRFSLN